MITDREKLEFESLPEFVREPRTSTRDVYQAKVAPAAPQQPEPVLPKSAELEALWPGVNHDFLHAAPKKGPSFYLTIGFMAGAVVSLVSISVFSAASHLASAPAQPNKEIVVAKAKQAAPQPVQAQPAAPAVAYNFQGGSGETIMPESQVYEVCSGDTLAGIALKNYHRATPRLLDEICRANNMSNANVLNLGQKLTLPEYHPQTIATSVNQVQQ